MTRMNRYEVAGRIARVSDILLISPVRQIVMTGTEADLWYENLLNEAIEHLTIIREKYVKETPSA